MNKVHAQIGDIVRKAREKKKITQRELGDLIGYSNPQFISTMERGLSKVPASTLGKLIVILEIKSEIFTKLLVQQFKIELMDEIQKGTQSVEH